MILNTIAYRSDGIFSRVLNDDGSTFCVSLEHAFQFKDTPAGMYEPILMRGKTYTCVRGQHHLESMPPGELFETFEILGVTDVDGNPHTGVIWHWGNWNRDSKACILVGQAITNSPSGEMVTNSKETFRKFMLAQTGIDQFLLTVQ